MLRDAAESTIAALVDAGRLDAIDSALVEGFLALADQLDHLLPLESGKASLFREFRAYHEALMAIGGETDGDDLDRLIAEMSAPVRHEP